MKSLRAVYIIWETYQQCSRIYKKYWELPIAANVWRQNTDTPAARRDVISDTSRDQSRHIYLQQRRIMPCVIYAVMDHAIGSLSWLNATLLVTWCSKSRLVMRPLSWLEVMHLAIDNLSWLNEINQVTSSQNRGRMTCPVLARRGWHDVSLNASR